MKRFTLLLCAALLLLLPLTAEIHAAPAVSAEAAVLIEAESGAVLADVNAHRRMPMASTTKIMTALVVLEHCSDLSRTIAVSPDAVGVEGSSVYLKAGEELSVEQLLYALLLESANDAAAALAIEIAGDIPAFAQMMNAEAARLGLADTHFTNPHGLDDPEHYSSAYDLAMLARYALSVPAFAKIASTYRTTIPLNGDEGTRVLINHNKMLKYYSGSIGVKTGYTKRCGRCLVSAAERGGVTMIAVTLSAPDDWQDHTLLLDYGFSLYTRELLADPGQFSYELSCLGGDAETVSVSNHAPFSAVLPVTHGEITVRAEANRYLAAPICQGDEVGALVFSTDQGEIGRIPLIADTVSAAAPAAPSLSERVRKFLRIS